MGQPQPLEKFLARTICALMNSAFTYFDKTLELLQQIRATQTQNIEAAADLCADHFAQGGLIFLFGAGHFMMCEEMTPRQGCFVGFYPLVEQARTNHAAVGMNGLRGPLFLERSRVCRRDAAQF